MHNTAIDQEFSVTKHVDFLLIGGGLASAMAAETLRSEGAEGSILILAAEDVLPYHRPPLDKRRALGAKGTVEPAYVHSAERYRELGIELFLGTAAISLNRVQKTVRTDKAGTIGYGNLLIATGTTAVKPVVPGIHLRGVYCLHTLEDARAVHAELAKARRAVVVGGSFIGLEVASTLRQLDMEVTLIEQRDTIFPMLSSPEISEFLGKHCRENGIEILLSDPVSQFTGVDDHVSEVHTASGAVFPCDLVVLGMGVTPNTGFLSDSGLQVANGIVVNHRLQTEDPHIFAAGDVANFPDPVCGEHARREHWDNAIKQGRLAAKNMMGQRLAYDQVSYFSSGVFNFAFEFFGVTHTTDKRVLRGSLESRSVALFYMQGDVIRGLFSSGRPARETKAIEAFIRYHVNLKTIKSHLSDPEFALEGFPNQTVLILQGGGALGAFECGAVQALEEAHIYPNIVAGVSIGALNGAIIAGNPKNAAAVLKAFWNELVVEMPLIPGGGFSQAMSTWQILTLGVPNFFVPHWMSPSGWGQSMWTSIYDPAPMRRLLQKYVDFSVLKKGPVRLLASAVNVETGEFEVFDSYVDDITVDHILASCSLPPGFPWTTINGQHYWDGGIVSNSPLEMVLQRSGTAGKRVFIIDLFANKRGLPSNLLDVQARRDEIGYSERIHNDVRARELVSDFRRLVEELMGAIEPNVASRIKESPRFVQLMGDLAATKVTRIVREGREGESASRDYDFSRAAIERNMQEGYQLTKRAVQPPRAK